MELTHQLPPLSFVFPDPEESDSSCGETTEAEDQRRGGYHPAKVGETFKSGRYRALCRLGSGHFSTVWLCFDAAKPREASTNGNANGGSSKTPAANPKGKVVALKIQKSAPGYTDAAHDEIRILQSIDKAANGISTPVVRLLDNFEHIGPNGKHVCLVFDVMGGSLLHLIKRFNFNGIPIDLVRRISRDLLVGLDFLHTRARVIHTDLKPENILMCIPPAAIRELDIQGAAFNRELLNRKWINQGGARRNNASTNGNGNSINNNNNTGNGTGTGGSSFDGTENDSMNDSENALGSKGQRKRRRRKLRAKLALEAVEGGEGGGNHKSSIVPIPQVPLPAPGGASATKNDKSNSETTSRENARSTDRITPGGNGDNNNNNADDKEEEEDGDWDIGEDANDADDNLESKEKARKETTPETNVLDVDAARDPRSLAPRRPMGRAGTAPNYHQAHGDFNLKGVLNVDSVFAGGRVAIVDLGNACWVDHQFTGDIQTRQYRSPEVIMGASYNTAADMFSVACLVFELLTGEYLFDPHTGQEYDRDEDHLAQMMELLGPMPRFLTTRGRYARDLFNRNGQLRNVPCLRNYDLNLVLMERFEYPREEAEEIAAFLIPMLNFDPQKRATAKECLRSPFLMRH